VTEQQLQRLECIHMAILVPQSARQRGEHEDRVRVP
jgi:hypothetical protein